MENTNTFLRKRKVVGKEKEVDMTNVSDKQETDFMWKELYRFSPYLFCREVDSFERIVTIKNGTKNIRLRSSIN